jgi:hypothetical protein
MPCITSSRLLADGIGHHRIAGDFLHDLKGQKDGTPALVSELKVRQN